MANRKLTVYVRPVIKKEEGLIIMMRTFWPRVIGFRIRFNVADNIIWSEIIQDGIERTKRIEKLSRRYSWVNVSNKSEYGGTSGQ